MPIYTSQIVSNSASLHPLYKQRGITRYTHARLSDLNFTGIATTTEVAYSAYRCNIDAFLAATILKKRVNTYDTGFDISSEDIVETPFGYPPVSFQFKGNASEDQLQKFLEKNAESKVAFEPIGRDKVLTAYAPSKDFLTRMPKFAKPSSPTKSDTCEPQAIRWIGFVWKAIDAFLSVNTYPAYLSEDGQETSIAGLGDRVEMPLASEAPVGYSMRARRLAVLGTDQPFEEAAAVAEAYPGKTGWAVSDLVLHAKPSPLPSSINIGPVSACPNFPGLSFPYFPGMIIQDKITIRKIVSKHFMRLFGKSTKDIQQAYVEFRREIDSFTGTELGRVFAHILFVMDLTLQTQARLYLIVEGRNYIGCAMLGARLRIHTGIEWHASLTPDELRAELMTMATHDTAIESLISQMNKLTAVHDARIASPFSTSQATTPAILADMMSSVTWTKEARESVEASLMRLSWPGKRYRELNLKNIIWAVETLSNSDAVLDPEMLFYIPHKNFEGIATREWRIIAAFGPTSFSMLNTKGQEFKILAPKLVDPADNVDPKTKKKSLPHLLISFKPAAVAVDDWSKMVKARSIKIDLRERAQGHRNLLLSGPSRDALWETFRVSFGNMKVEETKKRKGDDEMDAGPSRKKSKAFESEDFDLGLD